MTTAVDTSSEDADPDGRQRRSLRSVISRSRLQRAGWGIGDQALSSVTNFALAVVVARTAGPEGFGAFSLAFGVYAVAISVSQGASIEALTIRFSAADTASWRQASKAASASSLIIGLVGGIVVAATGALIGTTTGWALVALGVGLPLLLLQDCWRYTFFAARRGAQAFLNDLVWGIALTLAFGFVLFVGWTSVPVLVAAWIFGASAAALFGLVQARLKPDFGGVQAWWRRHSDLAVPLTLEALILSGSKVVLLAGMGLVASLATVGSVRAAIVLLGALRVLTVGISLFATPEAVNLLQRSVKSMLRFTIFVGTGLALVSVTWGTILMVMPDDLGEALLGETWKGASAVLLPITVVAGAAGAQIGAVVTLRALARATRSLLARSLTALLQIGSGVVGAALYGAQGAAWGLAGAQIISAGVWWYEASNAARAAERVVRTGALLAPQDLDPLQAETGLS